MRSRGAQSEPLAVVLTHDVKQRSVLRSRGALLRPGLACFLSHPLRRDFADHPPSPSFGAQASRPLSASATTDSRPPDEGWMERRQAHSFFRSRLRRATTLSRGDRDLSRRSTVAIFGCGPTKSAPGSGTGAAATARAKPLMPGGRGPDLPTLRFAPQSWDATPRSAFQDRLRKTPSMSEDGQSYTINSLRSQ